MFREEESTEEASLGFRMGQLETFVVLASDFSEEQDMSEEGFSKELFLERFLKKSFLLWVGKVVFFSNVIHEEGVELLLPKLLEAAAIEVDLVTGVANDLLLELKLSFTTEETPFNSLEALKLWELTELIFCISEFG